MTSGGDRHARARSRVYVGSVPATGNGKATIRATPETRDRLKRIAGARGMSAGELVDELATQAEDLALLNAMASRYGQLKSDAQAWEHCRAEISAWDATANDGFTPDGEHPRGTARIPLPQQLGVVQLELVGDTWVLVFAVTARFRRPTCSPIRAQGTPPRSRPTRRWRTSCGLKAGTPLALHARVTAGVVHECAAGFSRAPRRVE